MKPSKLIGIPCNYAEVWTDLHLSDNYKQIIFANNTIIVVLFWDEAFKV